MKKEQSPLLGIYLVALLFIDAYQIGEYHSFLVTRTVGKAHLGVISGGSIPPSQIESGDENVVPLLLIPEHHLERRSMRTPLPRP